MDVMDIPRGYCQCGCGQETKPARHTNRRLGWVKGEPVRCVLGHGTRKPDDRYRVEDRGFDTPCWIWENTSPNKYGSTRGMGAHVYYYLKYVGPIPEGYVVHHQCEVRSCVNPEHLEATTISLNRYFAKDARRDRKDALMPKRAKAFRLSEAAIKRLETLAATAELSQTAYLEQLLKKESEKNERKSLKTA